jgi:hypothetical protein
MSTLERRIAAALTSDIPSADIAALVAETEAAISQVEAAAEAEREMALDPLASPDAAKARTAMEDAAFTRDRLRTVLPRLQERLQQVQAAEYAARWEADFEEVGTTQRDGTGIRRDISQTRGSVRRYFASGRSCRQGRLARQRFGAGR